MANEGTDASRSHALANLVKKVNLFFNTFLLHDNSLAAALQDDPESLLQRIKYHKNCPVQENSTHDDCGVFAIACVYISLSASQ